MADPWATPPTLAEKAAAGTPEVGGPDPWATPPTAEELGAEEFLQAAPPVAGAEFLEQEPAEEYDFSDYKRSQAQLRRYQSTSAPKDKFDQRQLYEDTLDEIAASVLKKGQFISPPGETQDERQLYEGTLDEIAAAILRKQQFGPGGDKDIGIIGLQERTGLTFGVIEDNYDEIEDAVRWTGYDPHLWRITNPGQFEWITTSPEAVGALQDEKISGFALGMRQNRAMQRLVTLTTGIPSLGIFPSPLDVVGAAVDLGRATLAPPDTPVEGVLKAAGSAVGGLGGLIINHMIDTFTDPQREAKLKAAKEAVVEAGEPRQVPVQESEHQIGGPFDSETYAALWDKTIRTAKGLEASALGMNQLLLDVSLLRMDPNEDPKAYEAARSAAQTNRKAIIEIEDSLAVQQDYGQGEAGQYVLDAVEGLTSQAVTGASLAGGIVIGGIGGGIAGLAVGGPAGAIGGVVAGTTIVTRTLMAGSTLTLEGGGAYNEFVKMEGMDPYMAIGAALLSGTVSMLIEQGTFATKLKALGPVGEALATGRASAWRKSINAGGTKLTLGSAGRAFVKSGKGVVAEGQEEWWQEGTKIGFGWLAQSLSIGSAADFDFVGTREATDMAWYQGVMGSVFLAGGGVSINLIQRGLAHQSAVKGGEQVASIAELANSDLARHAPKLVTKLVKIESRNSQQTITHLYTVPQKLAEIIKAEGGNLEETLIALMGPEGPARFKEALQETSDVPGGKATLAIPVEEYLEKWGGISEMLAQDTTARAGHETTRELKELPENFKKLVEQLIREAGDEDALPTSPMEAQFIATLEDQLMATQKMSRLEAKETLAPKRAFVRTMLAKSPEAAEAVFQEWTIQALSEETLELSAPAASKSLAAKLVKMTTKQRTEVLFIDNNIGIFSERGFKANLQKQGTEGRFLVRYKFEGTKWKNAEGHTPGNELYRLVGGALAELTEDAAKWGADLAATVASFQEGVDSGPALKAKVLEKLRAANPEIADQIEGLDVIATVVPINEDLDAAWEKAGVDSAAEAKGREALLEGDPNRRAVRGERPLGLPMEDPRDLSLPKDMPTLREVPEALVKDVEAMIPEEVFRAGYVDLMTKMLTREGFFSLDPKKYVFSLDLNGLGAYNDAMDKEFGNAILRAFSNAARLAGASTLDMAHLSGDEFVLQSDDLETAQFFIDVLHEILETETATQGVVVETKDGRQIKGITLGYGIGENYDAADAKVKAHKDREIKDPGAEARDRAERTAVRSGERELERKGSDQKGVDRGGVSLAEGREDLARGSGAQSHPRVLKRTLAGARGRRAATRTLKVNAARREIFRATDPVEVSRLLQDLTSPESVVAGDLALDDLQPGTWHEMEEVRNRAYAGETLEQPVFHGSPVDNIVEFSLAFRKTGEGVEAFGAGMYFAESEKLAEEYRENITKRSAAVVYSRSASFDSAAWKSVSGLVLKTYSSLGAGDKTVEGALERVARQLEDHAARLEDMFGKGIDDERLNIIQELLKDPSAVSLKEPGKGQVYKAEIPENEELLSWDKPLEDQQPILKKLLKYGMVVRKGKDLVVPADALRAKEEIVRTGEELHLELSDRLDGDQQTLSIRFDAAGIPGLAYLDGASRSDGEGTQNFVVWDESRMPITDTLYQPGDDQARGLIDITRDGAQKTMSIFLGKDSDLSTMLHEQSHAYLEMMHDIATHEKATDAVKKDYARMLKWLGADSFADVTSAQKEKWARTFEAYFREGKAPSADLAGPFALFSMWLKNIYKTVGELNAPMDPEITELFDRMLATDNELKRMQGAAELSSTPRFSSHIEAGMTPDEFDLHNKLLIELATYTNQQVQKQVAQAQQRALEAWRTEEFAKIKEKITDEWDAQPSVQSRLYMVKGRRKLADGRVRGNKRDNKIHRGEVIAVLGKGHPFVKTLEKAKRLSRVGEDPDFTAGTFGYTGGTPGKDMLEAAATVPNREEAIDTRTKEAMKEANPEIDGQIADLEEYIQRELHDERTTKYLLKELSRLTRKVRKGDVTNLALHVDAAAKEAGAVRAARRKAGFIDLGQTRQREESLAHQAIIAAVKGNNELVQRLVMQRITEHYTWKALEQARQDRTKFEKHVKRWGDRKTRERIASGNTNFLHAGDQLLEAVGLREASPDIDTRTGIEVTLSKLEVSDGGSPVPVEDIVAIVRNPPENGWKGLTVEQMRQVHAVLKKLYVISRERRAPIVNGVRVEHDTLVDKVEDEGNERHFRGPPPGDKAQKKLRNRIEARLSTIIGAQEILRLLPTLYDTLWTDGYMRGEKIEDLLAEEVLWEIKKIFEKLPKALKKLQGEPVRDDYGVTMPQDLRDPPKITHEAMWVIALSMGSESNRKRTVGGYGWDEGQVMGWLDRNMSDPEWDFVESLWALSDGKLWSQVSKTYEEANGLPPEKIQAKPFTLTSGRIISGGYHPAQYDRVNSRVGAKQQAVSETGLVASSLFSIALNKSHTKPRVKNFTDVVRLDLGGYPSHIANVIHHIAFDRFIRQSRWILGDPRVQATIQERIGPSFYKQLTDPQGGWLAAVAQPESFSRNMQPIAEDFGWGRKRLMVQALALNVPVAANAVFEGFEISFMKGGASKWNMAKYHAKAFSPIPGHGFLAMRRKALTLGHEPKRRVTQMRRMLERELRAMGLSTRLSMNEGLRESVIRASFIAFDLFDRWSVGIVWNAAFDDAVKEGKTEKQAAVHADDVIVSNFPGYDAGRLPAVMRGPFAILMMIFHGYFNKRAQGIFRTMDPVLQDWHNAEGAGEKAMAGTRVAMAVASLMMMMLASQAGGELVGGHGPEPDEGWGEWMLRKMMAAPFQFVPFAGGPAQAVAGAVSSRIIQGEAKFRSFSERSTPLFSVGERLLRAGKGVLDGEREAEQRFWDAMEIAGLYLGYPIGAVPVSRAGRFVTSGEFGEASVVGKAEGILHGGGREAKEATPFTFLKD